MATAIQFLRSSISSLRPSPPSLSDGMPMVNFNANDPGLYFKLNDQSLMKVGPTQISDLAPNSNPSGYEFLSKGEMWLDTTIDPDTKPRAVLKLWDGSQWVAGGGDISVTELPQEPGMILAGPITLPDATPSFRPLEDSDLPDNISPNKLGGFDNGILLIGGISGGFAEAHLSLGDNSLTATLGENLLRLEVTAGNIAGKGGDGTIKTGDGHIQLNYGGIYTADNRFKFLTGTGTLQSQGPTELGLNPLTDTHTIVGATTISGDVVLTNVYNLTVGGDGFVGHNMTIGSDTTELLDVYNKTEFYSDVFIKDSKTLDIDGFLTVHRDTIIGDTPTQTLQVNATTTIEADTVIGTVCGQYDLTIKSDTLIECDLEVLGSFASQGAVDFLGDVTLGGDCSNFVAIQGTQLNKCDVYIGTNVPNPNAEQIVLDAATGDITTKGDVNVTGDIVVSDPLTAAPPNFVIDGATGDATSQGTITADFFAGDGSQLFNLAVPNSMLFHGDIDATTAAAPAGAQPGDFWLNNTGGTVQAGWPDIGGQAIQLNQFIYFSQIDAVPTYKWVLGSVQDTSGFVTIATTQDILATKTFKAPTLFDENVTVRNFKATSLTGTLTVDGQTLLKDVFTVDTGVASILNGTLTVDGATELNNTLTVTVGNASTFEGTVLCQDTFTVDTGVAASFAGTVTTQTELTTLIAVKDCAKAALLVNGTATFECDALFNAGIALGPGANLSIGGSLAVDGNTTLGTACNTSVLTVNSTTAINCNTTINATLTVGAFLTTLGGNLIVDGNSTLNGTLTVAAAQATNLGGTLDVAAGQATSLGGTLTVAAAQATNLGGPLTVSPLQATNLGGTLTVTGATLLNETLTVAAGKATALGGTLVVDQATTLFPALNCASTALTVNGLAEFNCLATFNGGISLPGALTDLLVGGNLTVEGNTTLGDNCSDLLTINSTTTINCATEILNTLTVTGVYATTLGGSLSCFGNFTVNTDKFTVQTATGNTVVAGTLTVQNATTAAVVITGKATSESTILTDIGTTLVTKDYVDTTGALWVADTVNNTLKPTALARSVLPTGDGAGNLGAPAARWANLYTQDMHFNNEGTDGNDVDGTTGNWTLQEGNDHIFFINNKTGAKFRVVMESVG